MRNVLLSEMVQQRRDREVKVVRQLNEICSTLHYTLHKIFDLRPDGFNQEYKQLFFISLERNTIYQLLLQKPKAPRP